MAVRNIVKKGDEILRKKCKPIEVFDEKLGELLDDMIETLQGANGVGLAGPQVGTLRRLCVIYDEDLGFLEMVNPVIVKFSKKQERDIEGCLSCPDKWGYVTRPTKCVVRAQDRHGDEYEYRLSGLSARCAFHEIDHLDGKLFIDFVDEFVAPEDLDKHTKKRKRK